MNFGNYLHIIALLIPILMTSKYCCHFSILVVSSNDIVALALILSKVGGSDLFVYNMYEFGKYNDFFNTFSSSLLFRLNHLLRSSGCILF